MRTILYANADYPDQSVERAVYGPADIRLRSVGTLDELADADCAEADGLLVFRAPVRADDLPRFTRLRAVVRLGWGMTSSTARRARRAASWCATCRITAPRRSRTTRWRWR